MLGQTSGREVEGSLLGVGGFGDGAEEAMHDE